MINEKIPPASRSSRINGSMLQPAEAFVLAKLVRKLPRWVTPDMLTYLGLAGAVVAAGGYLLSDWNPAFLWLSSLGFVIHWFGDSLDGTLARYRQIERPRYGFFVDSTTDLAAQIGIGVGLGLSPYVSVEAALAALVTYLAVFCVTLAKRSVSGVMQISFYGGGGTELRCLFIAANTALFFLGPVAFQDHFTFVTSFGIWTAVDFLIFGICALALPLLVCMVAGERRALALLDPPRS